MPGQHIRVSMHLVHNRTDDNDESVLVKHQIGSSFRLERDGLCSSCTKC